MTVVATSKPMPADTEAVWRQFRKELLGFIRRRVRQEADAEDVLQKVFLNLHRRLLGGDAPEHLRGWLYQIARNAVTDSLRSGRAEDGVLDATAAEPTSDSGESDARASEHLARCLGDMVQTLPAKYRDALVWTELQGATQALAAERAGVSLSGMKSRVQRGREQLREALLACCAVELDATNKPIEFQCRRSDSGCNACSD